MKQLTFTVVLIFTVLIGSASENKTDKTLGTIHYRYDDAFRFPLNAEINVEAIRSTDLIKTKNIITKTKQEFQVDFHFDDGQLYYILFTKADLGIDKTYEIKRIFKDGYGYRSVKADYKIDFFFPREKPENENIQRVTGNLDFANDDQMISYFEVLYKKMSNHLANQTGTVAFFGDAVAKSKINFLYYRFDDEKFSPAQKIKVQESLLDPQTKKYDNGYRIDFNQKQLKNHKAIYFSQSLIKIKDTMLVNQAKINLVALRKKMSPITNETIVNNDIFLDDYLGKIISQNKQITKNEIKYIGRYATKSSTSITFELKTNNIYFRRDGDIEYTGVWKLEENEREKSILVFNIFQIDSKIGSVSKPADVGSSLEILIKEEKLFYPYALPGYVEAEKI